MRTIINNLEQTNLVHLLELTNNGNTSVVIQQEGKPTAALIDYEFFRLLEPLMEEIIEIQEAKRRLKNWMDDPSLGTPFGEFEQELINEGLFDNN